MPPRRLRSAPRRPCRHRRRARAAAANGTPACARNRLPPLSHRRPCHRRHPRGFRRRGRRATTAAHCARDAAAARRPPPHRPLFQNQQPASRLRRRRPCQGPRRRSPAGSCAEAASGTCRFSGAIAGTENSNPGYSLGARSRSAAHATAATRFAAPAPRHTTFVQRRGGGALELPRFRHPSRGRKRRPLGSAFCQSRRPVRRRR